ncbi:MAG: hypothetical protein ABJB74_20540 [Gemmatimonas sp.]
MPSPVQALTILLSIAAILLILWGGRREAVAPIITIAWVLHCTLWVLSANVIQLFLAEPIINSAGPLSREQLALLSAASMLALVLCHIGFRRPLAISVTRFFDEFAPPLTKLFWPTAFATISLGLIERALSAQAGSSFAEGVSFAVNSDSSQQAQYGLLGTVETMLIGYAIAVISLGRRTGVTRNTQIMAWCSITLFCGFMISRGSRAAVFLPIVLGLVALSAMRGRARRRASIAVTAGSLALIIIGAPVSAIMGAARGGTGGISLQLVQDAYDVTIGSRSIGERIQLLAEELNRKFDAIGTAVELLAMEPPGSAGVQPILSASLSPIPRVLYLTKPVPTSRDGTNLGTPYRVAAKAYGDVDAGMIVPVSAVAIAVWEYGGVGALVFLIMNLFNLILVNSVFMSRNVIARALAVSMLAFSTTEMFIAPPSLLVATDLRLMMYLVALAIASLGFRRLGSKQQWHRAAKNEIASASRLAIKSAQE